MVFILIAEKTHSRVGITQPGYYGDIEEVRRSSFHYPLLRQEVSGAGPCPQRSQDTQKTLTSFSQSTKVHFHPREGLIMKQRIIWVGLKRQKSSSDEVEGPTKHDDGEADWKKNWPRRKLPLMSNWAPWLPDARQMTNWPNLAQTKHTETNQMRLVGSHSHQIILLENVRRHQRNRTLAIDVDFVWYFFTFWKSRKISEKPN